MNSNHKVIETETSEAAIQPALILIPDISGFTEYMSNSDLIHCRYIIAELLEVILNSNTLGLSVSELEGDAVLFYKFGKPPTLEKIITVLVDHYGWDDLGFRIRIRCFNSDPSVKSSLKFLRKTPWARAEVEALYIETLERIHPA